MITRALFIVFFTSLYSLGIFSQEKVKLKDGRTIMVKPDNTWEYVNEDSKPSTHDTSSVNVTLSSSARLFHFPNTYSVVDVEAGGMHAKLLDYFNELYYVELEGGQRGFISHWYIEMADPKEWIPAMANLSRARSNKEGKSILIKGGVR